MGRLVVFANPFGTASRQPVGISANGTPLQPGFPQKRLLDPNRPIRPCVTMYSCCALSGVSSWIMPTEMGLYLRRVYFYNPGFLSVKGVVYFSNISFNPFFLGWCSVMTSRSTESRGHGTKAIDGWQTTDNHHFNCNQYESGTRDRRPGDTLGSSP